VCEARKYLELRHSWFLFLFEEFKQNMKENFNMVKSVKRAFENIVERWQVRNGVAFTLLASQLY